MKTALSILLLFLAVSTFSFAQPGTLDSTYGVNGVQNVGYFLSGQLATTRDNKMLIAAESKSEEFIVQRRNSNGSLDNSFGDSGVIIVPEITECSVLATAFQTDNKLMAAGGHYSGYNSIEAYCLRLKADGYLDSTFGNNGIVYLQPPIGYGGIANSIVLQKDGKILISGILNIDSSYAVALFITRLNTDGSTDSTFGSKGIIILNDSVVYESSCMKMLKNGDLGIVSVVGNTNAVTGLSTDSVSISAKYLLPNGSYDSSYGINGSVSYVRGIESYPFFTISFIEQASGKLLIPYLAPNLPAEQKILRLNTDGSIDSSWGVNGDLDLGVHFRGNFLLFDNHGKCIFTSYEHDPVAGGYCFVAKEYNDDASLDSSFGNSGTETVKMLGYPVSGVIDTEQHTLSVMGTSYGIGNIVRLKLEGYTEVPFLYSATSNAYLYPNPASSRATVHFSLNKTDAIFIAVYDVSGRALQTIMQQKTFAPGSYNIPVNLSNLQPGIYFIRLQSNNEQQTLRLVKE